MPRQGGRFGLPEKAVDIATPDELESVDLGKAHAVAETVGERHAPAPAAAVGRAVTLEQMRDMQLAIERCVRDELAAMRAPAEVTRARWHRLRRQTDSRSGGWYGEARCASRPGGSLTITTWRGERR